MGELTPADHFPLCCTHLTSQAVDDEEKMKSLVRELRAEGNKSTNEVRKKERRNEEIAHLPALPSVEYAVSAQLPIPSKCRTPSGVLPPDFDSPR